ncbi:helix-turn-helix domain-containing protein [Cetobacterium sp.]|uniref:helix-turn-helix domain-containing protein n=1 Tax=Cetobacterium sp. TaxID=2071632 RepID=UPI003F4124FE
MFLLEKIKHKKKLTTTEIAKTLGTTYQFVASLIKGTRKMNITHIEKIFKAIDFSEEEKEEILLEFYLEDAPSDFKEKILQKINS